MSSFRTVPFIWQTPHTNAFSFTSILNVNFSFDLSFQRDLWLVQVFISPMGFWREDSRIFSPAWCIITSGAHTQWSCLGMVTMDLPYTWVLLPAGKVLGSKTHLEKCWEAVQGRFSFNWSSTGEKAQQLRHRSVNTGVSAPVSCSGKIRGPRVGLKKQLHRDAGSKVSLFLGL